MGNRAPMADELLTAEQREKYLSALREGKRPNVAAAEIGFTGTQIRGLRSRDQQFNEEAAAAVTEGYQLYQDQLQEKARELALEGSERMMEVELGTHVPKYEHLRRDRVRHEGTIEHAILLTPQQIEALGGDDLQKLIEVLEKAGGGLVVDGEFHEVGELPMNGASSNGA